MDQTLRHAGIASETIRVSDRHWRLLWDDNALDVMLRSERSAHVDGASSLFTRLASRDEWAAEEQEPFFAFPDALRRADLDVRLGTRRRSVPWDQISVVAIRNGLNVTLHSAATPLRADIAFRVDEGGVLVRDATLVHIGQGEIALTGAPSFAFALTGEVDTVILLSGEWGHETQVNRVPIQHAPVYLESRAGKTGFEYSPWLALEGDGVTTVAQLFWSGNWHLAARRGPGATYLSGGLPEHGFAHTLKPGEKLQLPRAVVVRANGDLNEATHKLHDYRRSQRPDPARNVPVQFNSWYPHPGEPDIKAMLELVPNAKRLNCEVFVLDAGWYTTEFEDPDENWWTRTGDWIVNRRLFPNGVEQLSEACRAAGLAFGIWFEPEALSPSSIVRRQHPHWVHHVDGQPPSADKRAILNLGIDGARKFARDRILAILETTQASWMKWDFNTDLRQGGWADPQAGRTHQDPVVAHYDGLYLLQDEIRAAFPGLTLEMCAGGGGRFDAAIMAHAHTNWMSDQKQPLRNLAIHFGSQLAHPPAACNDWLIEWPANSIAGHMSRGAQPDDRGDLAFRLLVPMLGSFGISAPVSAWPEADIETAARHVAWYREHVRPRVNTANQYQLTDAPPLDGRGDWAAMWYADKDRLGGVGLFFRLEGVHMRSFGLKGLDPTRRFRVRFLDGRSLDATGAELAAGLAISLDAHFSAAAVTVDAAD